MRYLIREKVFSLGDSFNIKDGYGKDVFRVHGEIFTFGDKLRIYDMFNNELVYIEQKILRFLPEYLIYMNDMEVATVKKELSFFKSRFNISSTMGNFDIEGDIFAHDFCIIKDGKVVAEVSKKWLSWGDTYEIDISEEENNVFILALIIVIDQVLYDDKNR